MPKRFTLAYFGGACFLMVAAILQPGQSDRVAVFSPPWGEQAAIIVAEAGGQLLSTDTNGWVAIAVDAEDGLVGRLYASGAMLVASAVVAQACAGIILGGNN